MERVRFDIGSWAGNRVSKHNEHAWDEIWSAKEFDGFIGWLVDKIGAFEPEIPELYTEYVREKDLTVAIPNPTVDVFRLAYAQAIRDVLRFINEESRNTLEEMEKTLNEKLKEKENGK